jgi:hypothetical protein
MSIGVTNIKKEHLYEMIQYYGPIYKNKESVISFGSIDLDDPRRRIYVNHFGFSVPSLQSVKQIAKYVGNDSILEIGSGLGLWAYLLSLEGVKIHATDICGVSTKICEQKNKITRFYDVENLDYANALKKYKTNVLMLIWPPHESHCGSEMSHNSLKLFQGNKLIYIGEVGDASGTDELLDILDDKWSLVEVIDNPKWIVTHTQIFFYEKK